MPDFAFFRRRLVEELPVRFKRRAMSAWSAAASTEEDDEAPLPLIVTRQRLYVGCLREVSRATRCYLET